MTTGNLGYLSNFANATLSININLDTSGSTDTAHVPVWHEPIGSTSTVIERTKTLANGTVVDWDGATVQADRQPGIVEQTIRVAKTDVATAYNAYAAAIGVRGTLTKTKFGSGTETCSARCLDVRPLPGSVVGKNYLLVKFVFQCMTEWA